MLSAGKPLQWIAAHLGHRGVAKILTRRTVAGEMRTSFPRTRSMWERSSELSGICHRLRPKRGRTCREFTKNFWQAPPTPEKSFVN
jgi:hypothetical protein